VSAVSRILVLASITNQLDFDLPPPTVAPCEATSAVHDVEFVEKLILKINLYSILNIIKIFQDNFLFSEFIILLSLSV
jgi:hypothetical protein